MSTVLPLRRRWRDSSAVASIFNHSDRSAHLVAAEPLRDNIPKPSVTCHSRPALRSPSIYGARCTAWTIG